MIDVYVTELYDWAYQVWVDGEPFKVLQLRFPPRLSWRQQDDIAAGFRTTLEAMQRERDRQQA